MFDTLYIEEAVREHAHTQAITRHLKGKQIIECRHYGELFNPKGQSFRLQKNRPALILAEKRDKRILPAPPGYMIGAKHNYYFSHMLNCVYDCRYCFLQGMYRSANIVLFVNYEDFIKDIKTIAAQHNDETVHFFSGYDGDSLALEPLSKFAQSFIPALRDIPNAWLELRTKSTQVRKLLELDVWPQCITAFSLTPRAISEATEHQAPKLAQRIKAIKTLQDKGWPVGLRLDPLIDADNFEDHYRDLTEQLFNTLDHTRIHSVSFGPLRMPDGFFNQMVKLYPQEKLFAVDLQKRDGMVSYGEKRERFMRDTLRTILLEHVNSDILFPCTA